MLLSRLSPICTEMSKLNCSKFISLHCSVDRELQRYCRRERFSRNSNFTLAKSLFSFHFLLFKKVREALIRVGRFFDITAYGMHNREKSLRQVAMVAKFLDENKPKRHLKSGFALFQTASIPSNFI